jgi:hypothetical protein
VRCSYFGRFLDFSKDLRIFFYLLFLHRRRHLQVNDIVAVRSPTNPDEYLCKRIVAMDGDVIPYGAWVDFDLQTSSLAQYCS